MPTLRPAFEAIEERIRLLVERNDLAGAAVAVTDRTDTLFIGTGGYANIDRGLPVDPGHLFQIGSIGKSFTAFALMMDVEADRVQLHRPVQEVLPWLGIPEKMRPITIRDLLTHSAGLPTGPEIAPSAYADVLALREQPPGFAPGTRFHYSNTGYKILGLVLERVAGQPYAEIVRERIFEPLGMTSTFGAIEDSLRQHTATRYVRLRQDRPGHRSQPFVEGTWAISMSGDGSISSPATDMAAYARMILNGGAHSGGRLVSADSFEMMTHGYFDDPDEPGARYGFGLSMWTVDGHRHVGHSGSMIGHTARLICDLDAGLGVVVLCASPGAWSLGAYVADAVRKVAMGEPPPPPGLPDPAEVPGAEALAGVYEAPGGGSVALVAEEGRLYLEAGGDRGVLEPRAGAFYVDLPGWDWTLLRVRESAGSVVGLTHGARAWYRHEVPPPGYHPPDWEILHGHYRQHSPWAPGFRVVLREHELYLLQYWEDDDPGEEESLLVPLPNGSFRVGAEEWAPSRIRFDMVVGGPAQRAVLDGAAFYRVFTP